MKYIEKCMEAKSKIPKEVFQIKPQVNLVHLMIELLSDILRKVC